MLFNFQHMRLCKSLKEVEELPEPKRVLATPADLSCVFSRSLFQRWCQNSMNHVIFTQAAGKGTIVNQIVENCELMQRQGRGGCLVEMDVFGRKELDGEELTAALTEREDKKAKKIKELLDEKKRKEEEAQLAEESDSDD